MKNTILLFAICLLGITTVFAQQKTKTTKMETIVLVHGAWSDASAWDAVKPLLEAKGHEVIVVNLPGHGKDQTSFAGITLQSYVDVVKAAIGKRKNVVLLGHSMAGVVISQVAEEIPTQIKELIYLAAYLPLSGDSLLALSSKDAGTHLGKALVIDEAKGQAVVKKDMIVDVFAADAPTNVANYLVANFKAEPLAPFTVPVTLTAAKFGSVKKVYIFTTKDNAVSYPYQQQMVKNTPVAKTYTLASSHTPFISVPVKLADIIIGESK